MQVGDVGRHRAARIDRDDVHLRPLLLRRHQPLVTAPDGTRRGWSRRARRGRPAPDPRRAGHRVRAEGALVAGDGRGHAEARIGVDVGRADEALHQLVGDVIVLGQQLAGDIEGDRVRAVLGDRAARSRRRRDRSPRPSSRALPWIIGMQQPAFEPDRLAERRSLGAEPAEIGGMLRIAATWRRCRRPRQPWRARRSRRRNRGRWS